MDLYLETSVSSPRCRVKVRTQLTESVARIVFSLVNLECVMSLRREEDDIELRDAGVFRCHKRQPMGFKILARARVAYPRAIRGEKLFATAVLN